MSPSVARRIALAGAAILVTTLVLVGIATGAVLHRQRTRALDDALLASVHGRAHPEIRDEVEIEHGRSPVDTWLVLQEDPRVPSWAADEAMRTGRPLFTEVGDRRLVLLRFEVEQEHDESARLAAASAPRVTLVRSVGPFAIAYSLLAAVAASIAALVLTAVVRHSFEPLERAREEAARVVGLGAGRRLTEDGPVEVRSLLAAINALLQRLDDAYHTQSRFTAEAAHELRTPVTAMAGELDVALRSDRTAGEYREVLRSSRDEVERLRRLVEGLTALARIDSGQIERGRESVRAAELATSALAAEQKTLERAGNSVRIEVHADPELRVQRSLVEAALANLLRNAARHAPGSAVSLRIDVEGDHVVFDVDDAGPGVQAEEREVLFSRFARSGEARRSDRAGLGLGLPIAREVARRHGGDCSLASSPSGGLRARLTLAIAEF